METFASNLSRIVAVESEVETVFRSTGTVKLDLRGAQPLEVQAFVCVLDGAGEARVFAALYARAIERCLVYGIDPESAPGLLDQGLSFVEALGFSMEEVGLNFGTAMREVLIKEIPVLCSPERMADIERERRARFVELEKIVAAEGEGNPPDDQGLSEKEREKASREREERARRARSAAGELAAEERAEKRAALLREEVDRLLAGPDEPASESVEEENGKGERTIHRLEKQLGRVRSDAKKKISALEKTLAEAAEARDSAEAECKALELKMKAGRKRLDAAESSLGQARREIESYKSATGKNERARAKLEERSNELERELVQAWREIEEDKGEKKRLIEAREAAEERIARMEKAIDAAEAALEEAERLSSHARKKADDLEGQLAGNREELAAAEDRAEQSARTEEAAKKRLAKLESELKEAKDSRWTEGERQERVAETEALRKQVADLQEALDEMQAASLEDAPPNGYEERIVALEEALEEAREEVEAERFEKELLAREKAAVEKRLHQTKEGSGEELPAGDDQARAPLDEMREALRRAEERTEFLRQELEKMTAAKVAAEGRLAETGSAAEKKEVGKNAGRSPRLSPMMAPQEISSGVREERRSPRKRAFFHVDWERSAVAYSSPEQVLEIHQSVGMVQLALEGYPNQHCSAYVVTLKRETGRQIYVVFRLAESERNLVYVPVRPVEEQAGFELAREEAFKFLEVVGYALEKVVLGKTPKNRARALKGVAVVTEVPRKVQGF